MLNEDNWMDIVNWMLKNPEIALKIIGAFNNIYKFEEYEIGEERELMYLGIYKRTGEKEVLWKGFGAQSMLLSDKNYLVADEAIERTNKYLEGTGWVVKIDKSILNYIKKLKGI